MQQHPVNRSNYRTYEGEWNFVCRKPCTGFLVEYSFHKFDSLSSDFLTNTPLHALEVCGLCGEPLEWAGYAGEMHTTNGILQLFETGNFMVSTVIIAAFIENAINNLLWAALVDNGLNIEKADKIVCGRIQRHDQIGIIRSIINWPIKDINFPVRNLVAHGKGFFYSQDYYKQEVLKQAKNIRKWIERVTNEIPMINFMPSECERWLLFMNVWSDGLNSYIANNLKRKKDT